MEPVSTNVNSKNCSNPIGSDCVIVSADMSSIGLCGKNNSLTSVLIAETNELNNLVQQLGSLSNIPTPVVDFSGLDLGCLYSASLSTYTCPAGWTLVTDSFGNKTCSSGCPNGSVPISDGAGGHTCVACGPAGCGPIPIPTITTIPNPTSRPNTLIGILQLMINKIPCCDPCNKSNL